MASVVKHHSSQLVTIKLMIGHNSVYHMTTYINITIPVSDGCLFELIYFCKLGHGKKNIGIYRTYLFILIIISMLFYRTFFLSCKINENGKRKRNESIYLLFFLFHNSNATICFARVSFLIIGGISYYLHNINRLL